MKNGSQILFTKIFDNNKLDVVAVPIKNRADLAKHFAMLGFKIGAEIGVLAGEYATVLCSTIPNLKYYGIDPWFANNDEKTSERIRKKKYELAKKNLASFDATIISKTSMQALNDFVDGSLDFVYIDGNHKFDFVVNDIICWTKKVRKGGIAAGHDYNVATTCGVIPAVNGYIQQHSINLNLTTDESEAISWWFVKKWNTT